MNLASMERALDIPQRTFAKWKNRSVTPSATGVTLLKFIKLFPWLVEVGDQKFDPVAADRIMIKNASERFFSHVTMNKEIGFETGVAKSGNNLRVYIDFIQNSNSESSFSTLSKSNSLKVTSTDIFTIA
jgi:hypothetical protein